VRLTESSRLFEHILNKPIKIRFTMKRIFLYIPQALI